MGQQHRVRAKRKRRRAYLQRKKVSLRATRRDPGDVQIFYSRSGQTADAIIERLANKYAEQFDLMVATSDTMEAETVQACGAAWISPVALGNLLSLHR